MITVTREEAKADPVYRKLFKKLCWHHKVPGHTVSVLTKNKHIKNFCEESRHFLYVETEHKTLYMHYDVTTWIDGRKFLIRLESATFYDTYEEYESARLLGLHSTIHQSGIPLN